MSEQTATTEQTATRPADPDFKWDFFLAHAGADLEAARKLKRQLEPPAEVFLDDEDISLGENWDRVLSEALRSSLIHIIMVSPNTEDAYYQCEEIAVAIQMAREDPHTRRVVPLYLNSRGVPKSVPYGLKTKHGLSVADENDLATAKERLLRTLQEIRRLEEKKGEVVSVQREAVEKIAAGGNADLLAGLNEVTRFVRPLLKTLLALLALAFVGLLASLLLPSLAGERALLATVFGSLCALLLAGALWLTARSLSYAQQIAQGRINGG
jgi:hypothetical protein